MLLAANPAEADRVRIVNEVTMPHEAECAPSP